MDPFEHRVRNANDRVLRAHGDYVLYWMIAARRPWWNFALDRAVDHARALNKPLLVFEPLEVDYPWASARFHRFVIAGMAENRTAFSDLPVTYFPYVEPAPAAGRGLLQALAAHACVVVTDHFPCFFLPKIVKAAAGQVEVRMEVVDSNGLLPIAATDRRFTAAFHFRRYVQAQLPHYLHAFPRATPLSGLRLPRLEAMPAAIMKRWPPASEALLNGDASALAALPVDHEVAPVAYPGGAASASKALMRFVQERLPRYRELHNEPQAQITSRLSPYLHFGHLSAHQVFSAITQHERRDAPPWTPKPATGAREGWWGLSASAEAYLDQLVTWRELGYNTTAKRPDDYDRFESLPDWARETLDGHRDDPRAHIYDRAAFEAGRTHDRLWNAAQMQMRTEGWFHNYMRLVWGKKLLEWSASPREALQHMIEIMNRWSLDGRNPNSYTGFLWTLGLYDRPWPERPVYGKVRSMSTENTARKVDVEDYIAKYAGIAVPSEVKTRPRRTSR